MTIEISQPVHQYVIQQAQKANCSPERWLQQHFSEAFGIGIPTREKARAQGQSVLGQYVGTILRVGTPTFEETTFQWHIPVLPNLRRKKPPPVGELHFDAKTGELHTDRQAIYDMAEKAQSVIEMEHLPDEVHRRMEELSNRADTGTLTPSEQKELDELAEQWLNHTLKNVQRAAANIKPPLSCESTS
jgi:hypothetical protein